MPRLTKRFVDSVMRRAPEREVTHWDDALRGFGLRVQPGGAAAWVIMYRTRENRLRKLTLGKPSVLTPDQARHEAKLKLADAEKGGDPAGDKTAARKGMTVTDLCDWYLREAKDYVKASTLAMDSSRIETHVKPLLGKRRAASLTSDDIERMQSDIAAGKTAKERKQGRGGAARGGRGVAARTVGMLATILEFAKRRKVIKDNPARGVARFVEGRQRRFLSLAEITALGAAMRDAEAVGENKTAVAAIRFLLLTGLRRMEALALPWSWVDAKAHCIRFEDTKSGWQVRAIGSEAVKLLEAQSKDDECPWVFPADTGEGHFVGLPRALQRLCARAKLAGVTVHVLRHSFAAVAAEMGFSELTIAGLLGHSLSGVTVRYAHVPDAALVTAADRVSARIAAALGGRTADATVVPFRAAE